ncbi:slipin family protein [Myroides sp. 1354]|uniref:slipin family protein n=1 Tax=unclassified Myroides TaxID=2642485 RepID=UPI002576BE78|nr:MULTISPECIES: slipin family protein [unclassified Myroides]MDM1044127.1 slipin family protein [Myroides sp. R163-1]MDM1055062.1 slipin family protein [Myroides sp. 1354]MDM1068359.1 slipin family protein [Myroides sp. 1372]
MKKLQVKTNHVALVFNQGELQKVYTAGQYWLWGNKEIIEYNQSELFPMRRDMDALLKNEQLLGLLDIVDVMDDEIIVVYKNKVFYTVFSAGRYIFWKDTNIYSFERYQTTALEVPTSIARNIRTKGNMLNFLRMYTVGANEKGLLFVDEQFQGILNAGDYCYWKNESKVQIIFVDVRQQSMDMNGQEILTKDKVQLRINFNIVYQVQNMLTAYVENKEVEKQMYNAIQLMLREKIGRLSFDELMENKENVSQAILEAVQEEIAALGIALKTCGIKDIILPGDIREIMNQVLIAEKKAQANMITRREETAATRSLLNTAKLMEENEMLMRLKEMEYIEKIADKVGEISLSGGGNVLKQLKEVFGR